MKISMKALLAVAFGMMLLLCSYTAMADVKTSGNFQYEVKGNGTATIVGYTGPDDQDIILPNLIDGYTITSIGDDAFLYIRKNGRKAPAQSISVTIPSTVTAIGEKAFAWRDLFSINIPDSVQFIGEGAFCGNFKCQYRITSSHTYFATIEGSLYNKNEKKLIAPYIKGVYTTFTIPKGIISIGDYAFADCEGTTDVILPETLRHIGKYSFSNARFTIYVEENKSAKTLDELTLPDSIATIDDYAFYKCVFRKYGKYSGKSIDLNMPSELYDLGESAFSCIRVYGDNSNYDKKNINVTFESSAKLREIKTGTFNTVSTKDETKVIIKNLGMVEKVGAEAFAGCWVDSLPNSLMEIGEGSFREGAMFSAIPGSCKIIPKDAFNGSTVSSNLYIQEGVERIESKAFTAYTTSISTKTVYLPASLKYIANDALPREWEYIPVKGSYAEQWLIEHAYVYTIEGDEGNLDWLNN